MRSRRCQERLVTVRPIGGGTGRLGRLAWKRTEWRVHYSVRSESDGGGGGVYWRQIETALRRGGSLGGKLEVPREMNIFLPRSVAVPPPPRCDRKTAWLFSPATHSSVSIPALHAAEINLSK